MSFSVPQRAVPYSASRRNFFAFFAFEVDQQTERHRPHNAHQPVKGGKAGGKVGKGRADGLSQPQQLMCEVAAQPPDGRPSPA